MPDCKCFHHTPPPFEEKNAYKRISKEIDKNAESFAQVSSGWNPDVTLPSPQVEGWKENLRKLAGIYQDSGYEEIIDQIETSFEEERQRTVKKEKVYDIIDEVVHQEREEIKREVSKLRPNLVSKAESRQKAYYKAGFQQALYHLLEILTKRQKW